MTDTHPDSSVRFKSGDLVLAHVSGEEILVHCVLVREETPGQFVALRAKRGDGEPSLELTTASEPHRFAFDRDDDLVTMMSETWWDGIRDAVRVLAPLIG